MRVASYRDDVLYGVANELDLDIGTSDFNNSHARKFANSITKWTKVAWRLWEWPDMILTEERALREIRSDAATYPARTEVYDLATGAYYRALTAIAAGDPVTNATKWELIVSPDPYLAYDQAGKQFISEVLSVHPTDPRRAARAGAGWQFYPDERGIRLPVGARPTVWVTYRPRPSQFTADLYDIDRTYKAGALVYDTDAGECFRAALDLAAAVPVTNPAWIWQRMPYVLAEYVRMHSAADASEDAVQKADFRAQAETAFVRESDLLRGQGAPAAHYRLYPRRDSRSAFGSGDALTTPYVLIEIPA